MYEPHHVPPVPAPVFARRLVRHVGAAAAIGAGSLAAGTLGFRHFESLEWVEALLQASLPLGGSGLAAVPGTTGGRLFASAYVLYAGLVFVTVTGIVVAPLAHRLLHLFHWQGDDGE